MKITRDAHITKKNGYKYEDCDTTTDLDSHKFAIGISRAAYLLELLEPTRDPVVPFKSFRNIR